MPAATVARTPELLGSRPGWVILDMNVPDGSRLAILHAIRRANLSTRDIVSSATKDEAKPLDPALLLIAGD
jgi:DNA-binding NarL/FixJ family response regulator